MMSLVLKYCLNIRKLMRTVHTGVAQRKRAGPITQRSEDRNLLSVVLFFAITYKM